MCDLVQLMTQTLKLDSKESCEDLPVPDPVSEFKLHRKYRDTLILHGKVAEQAEDLHFKELPLGDQFILLQQTGEHVYWRNVSNQGAANACKLFCLFILSFGYLHKRYILFYVIVVFLKSCMKIDF